MSAPRTSIIAGPARVTFQGQTVFSKDHVRVSTAVRAFEVRASNGSGQRREDRVSVQLTFTPDGAWGPVCALIQAFAGLAIGQDVFGPTNRPLVIESTDGQVYTFTAAALTRPPGIVFSGGGTLFGPATFSAVGANALPPTAPNRRVSIAASPYPAGQDGYDPAAVAVQPYTLSWGSADSWQNLETGAGVAVAFEPTYAPRRIDSAGLIGLRLVDLAITARARPLGVPDAAVLAAMMVQGAGAGRGRALDGAGRDLVIRGAGVSARLYSAGLETGHSEFGGAVNRVGELRWRAARAAFGGMTNDE